MEYKRTCKNCGKEFITNRIGKKYCSVECRITANKPHHTREDIKCERCGNIIHHPTSRQKYCKSCAYIAARERDKNSYIEHREEILKNIKSNHDKKRGQILYVPVNCKTIDEIAKAARESHMSYGKYVGLLYMGYTQSQIIALNEQNYPYNE